jgi:hypothetical protein
LDTAATADDAGAPRRPEGVSNDVRRTPTVADDFEYVSRTRLEYQNGARHAWLGDVPEPVVYG